jgi:hypothetical protein
MKASVSPSRSEVGLAMSEEPATVVIQRYVDASPGDPAPRLTRRPANLEADELLGGVVPGLLKALQTVRPQSVPPVHRPVKRRICAGSSMTWPAA